MPSPNENKPPGRMSDEAWAAIKAVRALVASLKETSTVLSVLRDYRAIEGDSLPYRKYGFSTVEDFLLASGEFVIKQTAGESTRIYIKPNRDSAHIMNMVSAQKSNGKSSSGSRRFVALRQPTTPSLNGRGFGGSTTQYSRIYQQLPSSGRNNGTAPSVNAKKISFAKPPTMTTAATSPRNKGSGAPSWSNVQQQSAKGGGGGEGSRPILKAQSSSNTINKGQTTGRKSNSTSPEANNNNRTTKNLNGGGTQQTMTTTTQLPTNDLRHFLNERNGTLSRSSVEMRQSDKIAKAALPALSAEKTPQPAPPAVANTFIFQRAQSLDERSATARVMQPQNNFAPNTYSSPAASVVHQPVVSLTGKKSLQDRLKVNQQVVEKDLEAVARLTQQQQPGTAVPFERTLSSTSTNSAVSTGSSIVSEQINAFAPTTRPTTFSWSDPNATPVELLVKYSSYKGYVRPEYRYYRLKNGRIQCRVTLNGTAYSTYPADFANEFEGQFAAALAAIEALQRDESRQTYSVCLDADPEIASTIYELLASCPHGMFSKNIPDAFRAAHQTLLPDHWFSIIDRYANQLFQLEEGPGDTIVFARDQPSSSDADSNTSEARQMAMNQLQLPWGEQYWNLYITHPVSTVEVWARLVGKEYSDKMDALITDIEMSMLNAQPRPEDTVAAVGEYYLVSITDCWNRVRVDEINYETNQCQCFFIDIGEKEQVALDALYPCDPKYLQLPGQAKCFTLDGLEDFCENPKGKPHLEELLMARVFIGEILTKREDYEAAESSGGPGSGTLKLLLYDTSSQYDVLLNPVLLTRICNDTPVPELNRKTVNYVTISHVDDQGDVYCQKDGKMQYIQRLITNLTRSNALEGEHRGLYTPSNTTNQRLYLVQDETDAKWYRAALDAKESGPYCRMLYVDVGCRRRANVSNLYRLEMISLALNHYPPQAIRMRMFELPGCDNPQVLARLRAFLRPAMPAMAKVFSMEAGTLPMVKVYVHVADGGEAGNKILVCVNEAIKIEQELEIGSELISTPRVTDGGGSITSSDTDTTGTNLNSSQSSGGYTLSSADGKELSSRFDGLNLSAGKKSNSIPTTSPGSSSSSATLTPDSGASGAGGTRTMAKLAKITLPPVGQLFDVKVTIVSNPMFFIVQPYAHAKQLNQLMCELQEFCMSKAQIVRKNQIRQGEAYAALNRDGHWYRIVVVNILFGRSPIHAYFCDFGMIEMLTIDNLRVLPANFRVLPQQAVKAKLYGVKPLNKDWQAEDAVRFQELTVRRSFASIVHSVQADEINKDEKLVELELIDVSGEDDVYIHKRLVDEGLAVYTAEAHTV
uniref:Tudor domain-containing protein 7 n=1 Tax=Anopheles atroparvus TaxID=41427 RepID=A0A182JIM9_ANOAO